MKSRIFFVTLVPAIALLLLTSLHNVMAAAGRQTVSTASLAGASPSDLIQAPVSTAAITITKSPLTQTVAQGATAEFTITITNTGDLTLTLAVVDPQGDVNCQTPPDNPLPAGTATSYLCTHSNVSESFTNVITVTGTHVPMTGVPVSVTAMAMADVHVVNPALTVVKLPFSQTVNYGGTAVFTVGITNSGDIPLALTAIDPVGFNDCDDIDSTILPAGHSIDYNCASTSVTADFTNILTITGRYTPTVGSPIAVSETAMATVFVLGPSLTVSKSPSSQTVQNGGTATFTISMTNGSEVALDLTVHDPLADPNCETLAPASLAAGSSVSYTCTSSNVTTSFTNTIVVTGTHVPTTGIPVQVTATDSAAVMVAEPEVIVSKLPATQTILQGSTANFTIFILNNGNVDLNLTVQDPLADENCESAAPVWLAAGASESYACTRSNVTADFTNVITVTGLYTLTSGIPLTTQDSASAFVNVVTPSLVITKSPEVQTIPFSGTAVFTISVSNSGDTALADVTISDPLAPACSFFISSVGPGTLFHYVCTHENVMADFTNVITVTGRDIFNNTVLNSDSALIDVAPSISVNKQTQPTQIAEPGATVHFTVTVNNDSHETVTVTQLLHNRFGDLRDPENDGVTNNSCLNATTIAATASLTCSFQAVFIGQPGVYTSRITAYVQDDEGNQVSSQATTNITVINLPPAMSVTATAVPNAVVAPGGQVLFTIRINNTSAADAIIIDSLTDTIEGNLNGRGTCETPQTILLNSFYQCSYMATVSGSGGTSSTRTLTASGHDDDNIAINQSSSVTVQIIVPPPTIVFLPVVFNATTSDEPNNVCSEAVPITTNRDYLFLPDDTNDWYYFDLASNSTLTVRLTNFLPGRGQIIIYRYHGSCAPSSLEFLANNGNDQETKIITLPQQPAGRYYLWVITDGPFSATQPYTLHVQVP